MAGRIETASEWHEVTVSVRVPEQSTRALVTASISPTHLEVTVSQPDEAAETVGTLPVAGACAEVEGVPPSEGRGRAAAAAAGRPYLWWRRRLQQRTLKYDDGHTSRTHIDTANSTWLLGTDTSGRRCVQFVLAQWMEGANKNQEEAIRKQLKQTGLSVLTEDSDPFHLFELLEAEVWLRAGAVYKARGALCEPARDLIKEMEGHEEREGRDPAALRKSPLADLWEEDAWEGSGDDDEEEEEEGPAYGAAWSARKTDAPPAEPRGGGEVNVAAVWWADERAAELDAWRDGVARAAAADEARRAQLEEARREAEARAAAAAADRRESEGRDAARRRKELLREHQRLVAAAREAEARAAGLPVGGAAAGPHTSKLEATIGAEAMRSAAAAAARANPLPPKPISPANVASANSATGSAAEPSGAFSTTAPTAGAARASTPAAAGPIHSLAKCGYWFEDAGEAVKVTVPLADACGDAELPKDSATCDFSRLGARLEVRLPTGCHVLTLPELFKEIVPEESELKLRLKTKRAALIMKKREPGAAWPKLAAV